MSGYNSQNVNHEFNCVIDLCLIYACQISETLIGGKDTSTSLMSLENQGVDKKLNYINISKE